MARIHDALSRLWLFISMKLGRCPFCMRAAARGALAAWVACVTLSLVEVHAMLQGLALLVALAFTALLLAHMAAFTWRAVPRVAQSLGWPPAPQDSTERREFLGAAIKVGATAVALSLLGFGRVTLVRASETRCKTQRLLQMLTSFGEDEDEARSELELQAQSICDTICAEKSCPPLRSCQALPTTIRRRGPFESVFCAPTSTSQGGGVTCVGILVRCDCMCQQTFFSPRCQGVNLFTSTGEGASREAAVNDLREQAEADCDGACREKDPDCEAASQFCVRKRRGFFGGARVRVDNIGCVRVDAETINCRGSVICPCECAQQFP